MWSSRLVQSILNINISKLSHFVHSGVVVVSFDYLSYSFSFISFAHLSFS